MKKISKFFIIASAKFKKLSSFFKYSVSIVCTFGLMAAFSGLPLSAIVIDGQEYEEVTITQQDLLNMFNNGDLSVSFAMGTTSSSYINAGTFYNMQNHTYQNPSISSSSSYLINSTEFNATAVTQSGVLLYSRYTYISYPTYSSILLFNFDIDFLFDGYIDNQSFYFVNFLSGAPTTVQSSVSGSYQGNRTYYSSGTSSYSVITWDSFPALQIYYNIYNWLPNNLTLDTIETQLCPVTRTVSGYTDLQRIDSLNFELFYNNSLQNITYYAPVAILLQSGFSIYLPPNEVDLVLEYLDLIASDTPSAGQQQRINQLRQSFNSVQSNMNSVVDDLHVEMPSDLPDVSGLPEEVVEGLESVSEYVVSPILNNPTITIILSSVFIFTVIKLLLFGSGPS